MGAAAPDFNKIIKDGRERKANEKLANQIFSRNRRQSAPSKLKTQATAPTLASRISKKPQRASLGGSRANTAPAPKANINGDWTHDLHASVSSPNLLASRITNPAASKKSASRRQNKLSSALSRIDSSADAAQQVNIVSKPAAAPSFSIRGIAGPFCVMAQNFARGTTAADVESAMTPIGGPMESCRLVKTEPFILVEMLFSSKEGGEKVIETFNNQTADGKILKVWAKIGGPSPAAAVIPTGPRSSRSNNSNNQSNDQYVDGKMGFAHPMERDNRGLYSDKMVSNANNSSNGAGRRGGRGGRGRR
ncbi:pentatricopeptide repeat protein [Sarocladium implicatum]|nr:pentatricopeptide repeat protein [Sarocladium implicatum]